MNETEKQYQEREAAKWVREMSDKSRQWFDNVAEFSARLEDKGYFVEQVEWICNGSYGSGACFRLQQVARQMETFRGNKEAVFGRFFLSAVFGHEFNGWRKLTPKAQREVSRVVKAWMKRKGKGYGQTLEA